MKIIEVIEYREKFLEAINRLLPQLSPDAAPLSKKGLKALIDSATTFLFLANTRGQFSGTLTLVSFTTPTGSKARIEDFIVDQVARRQGVGKCLIKHAMQHARASGARSIDLTSHPSRFAANALYKKAGFRLRETNIYSYEISA